MGGNVTLHICLDSDYDSLREVDRLLNLIKLLWLFYES